MTCAEMSFNGFAQVDTSSETEENESKDFFIRRKLEVLSSNQSGLGKMHYLEKRDHEDKIIDGRLIFGTLNSPQFFDGDIL